MEPRKDKKIFVTHLNIRQSIFFLLLKLIVLELVFALMFFVFVVFLVSSSFSSEVILRVISSILLVFVPLALLKMLLTLYVVLLWLNEYYEIKPDLICHKRGIFWRKEEHYPTRQIRAIKLEQGALGKLFQYGTITLYDWDLSKYATLYLIHNPIKYMRVLEGLLPKASQEKDIIREKITDIEE